MATIIDGKAVATLIHKNVAEDVRDFMQKTGITPGLATVLVGKNEASQIYVTNKIKATKACGMNSFPYDLPETTTENELLSLIAKLNQNQSVHGILVQLPLPKHISAEKVISRLNPKKDIDGFHPMNLGALVSGKKGFAPCTPLGIMTLLQHYKIDLKGKDVVIVGRSNIVGKPLALLMLQNHATVTITHSQTKNLSQKTKQADVVVAAVGQPKMISGEHLKTGAVVIDVGISRMSDGALCGDVNFESAEKVASFITPVPGGVGPMTIAMLMQNTLEAARNV